MFTCLAKPLFFMCILTAFTSIANDLGPFTIEDDHKPLPNQESRLEALKTIKDIFKDEYKKTKPEDLSAFAKKLLEQAKDSKDTPAMDYTLHIEAAYIASKAGDVETALRSLTELGNLYVVSDEIGLWNKTLSTITSNAKSPEAFKAVAEAYMTLADILVSDDNINDATAAVGQAQIIAQKAKDVSLIARIKAKADELKNISNETGKAQEALKKLKDSPDDPEKNLIAGRYFCFMKGEWKRGLRMLAKGGDDALKTAAELDIGANDAAGYLKAADAWWELGEKNKSVKMKLQSHASDLYAKAIPDLKGMDKAKAEKRISEQDDISVPGITNIESVLGYKLKKHPDDAVKHNNRYYKHFKMNLKWEEAYQKCKELGGYLMVIRNKSDDDYAFEFCNKTDAKVLWVGGFFDIKDKKWKWVTGEPFNYTNSNWKSGKSSPKSEESKLELRTRDGGERCWNDLVGYSREFVCEWVK